MPDNLILGNQLVSEFLEGIKQEMIDYLDSSDRNATGKSKASLEVVNISNIGGQLIGSDAIEYVFGGRPDGGMPPLNKIIDWCNARGIPRERAWAIAVNIKERGTELYRQLKAIGKISMLDEIINQKKFDKLTSDLTFLYTAQIQSEINHIVGADELSGVGVILKQYR